MEGTARHPVRALFLQAHVVLDDADDVCLALKVVDECLRITHCLLVSVCGHCPDIFLGKRGEVFGDYGGRKSFSKRVEDYCSLNSGLLNTRFPTTDSRIGHRSAEHLLLALSVIVSQSLGFQRFSCP